MVIDANVYWLPDEFFKGDLLEHFLACINAHPDTHAVSEESAEGVKIVIEKPRGCAGLDFFQADYQLEKQFADFEKAGVDQAILKLPGCQEWLDLDLCKIYNRAVAKVVKESAGRLIGLAAVPVDGSAESLAELEYAAGELGLKGVQVSAHYDEGYLDQPYYRPFFKKAAELDLPVYVHHTPVPLEYEAIKDYDNLRRSYGRCADQIIAVSREVYSDLFAEFPNLHLIHSMLGGGYFTYKSMLLPRDSGGGRFDTNNGAVKERLEQNIAYELSHAQPWGEDNLVLAAKILGAGNLIYGSSYPVKSSWLLGGPAMVKGLSLPDADKEAILAGNARRWYKLD
ncbi:hydrolase [Lactobacillus nasalidis]|uniref:Hydrolase n=1 Tax=Lactobacillus nasalidis TaxID=2797258 RepID=A0ABQ3W484_9LACO|nr:amidohydrolase family protein [Lactobacillus nasalidis]GHV97474.1 hydrolase [Lactobacillus nasalidis]GHV99677.1 hydrolase [Lactobacillus nasalidis]GHW01310.1 hydrolase [Lactobacillus nasalidis]